MGAVVPLETVRPTYATATIIFDNISQDYRHLEIIGQTTEGYGITADKADYGFTVQFNSNTSSTWTVDVWNGYNSSSITAVANDDFNLQENWCASGVVGAASAAGWRMYINDYSEATVHNCSFQSHGYRGVSNQYSGYMYPGDKYGCESMDGAIAAAITKITINWVGAGLTNNSELTLYGWKDS